MKFDFTFIIVGNIFNPRIMAQTFSMINCVTFASSQHRVLILSHSAMKGNDFSAGQEVFGKPMVFKGSRTDKRQLIPVELEELKPCQWLEKRVAIDSLAMDQYYAQPWFNVSTLWNPTDKTAATETEIPRTLHIPSSLFSWICPKQIPTNGGIARDNRKFEDIG